jgi:phage shock protein C
MNRRLYRSRKEKMIGGVCAGLAQYFDIDPVIVRIVFVVAVFMGGSGILAYIICWIIMPEEPAVAPASVAASQTVPQDQPPPSPVQESNHRGSMTVGIVLIAVGGLFLLHNIVPALHFEHMWPILLILLGVAILSRTTRNS